MSTNDTTQRPDDAFDNHAMTRHYPGLLAAAGTGWSAGVDMAPDSQAKGMTIMSYVHALRRHWLMAVGIGIVVAVAFGFAAWWARDPQYLAFAQLRIRPTDPRIVFATADASGESGVVNAFDIYKETQQQLVKSRFVLTAALRDPTVKTLDCIRYQNERHNTLNWLTDKLQVGFGLKNDEIMGISLSLPNPNEAAILVNAVVNAYMNEVINAELSDRQRQLDQVAQVCAENETKVHAKKRQLVQSAEGSGTMDTETLSLKQQIAVQEYGDFRRELTRIQFDLTRARGQLQAEQALLDRAGDIEVSEPEVLALTQNDPQYRQITERANWQQLVASQNEQMAVPGRSTSYTAKPQRDLQAVQAQYEELSKVFRERLRAIKRSELEKEVRKLRTEVDILSSQSQQFEKDVERQRKAAEQLGHSSIEVEMAKAELKRLDEVYAAVANERERLTIELKSAQRVQVLGNRERPAEIPETDSSRNVRIALIILASMIGMCLPAVGIALWDVQSERINGPAEISKRLGMTVLGSVPLIPARVIRQLGVPSKRNLVWKARLTECVDGVAARLLRKADLEQARVILVSSAMAGEGKTTLATQLAMSLARNLRRTLLIDFDLRRPTLDRVFGLPVEPGVCEALRGQADPADLVHPTATDQLSVMMAGRWDRQVLAALTSGRPGVLLDKLRADYDFIILDSSPILPIADTRLVSQHVDSVVLSVLRDVSQSPRVLAASEILEAFGVQSIEVVVTGPQEHLYGKALDYSANEDGEQLEAAETAEIEVLEDDTPKTDAV